MDYSVTYEHVDFEPITVTIVCINENEAEQLACLLDNDREEGKLPFYTISRDIRKQIGLQNCRK